MYLFATFGASVFYSALSVLFVLLIYIVYYDHILFSVISPYLTTVTLPFMLCWSSCGVVSQHVSQCLWNTSILCWSFNYYFIFDIYFVCVNSVVNVPPTWTKKIKFWSIFGWVSEVKTQLLYILFLNSIQHLSAVDNCINWSNQNGFPNNIINCCFKGYFWKLITHVVHSVTLSCSP